MAQVVRINNILDELVKYHPEANLDLVEKAYVFSAKVHQGQVRLSGEPYLTHPLTVAYILSTLKLDEESVATGLLHDTVEDTFATLEEIKDAFGEKIASLVEGLTKISKITSNTKEEKQAENVRKMILAMSKDIRVILIKLADRLHNMRTLKYLSPDKQKEIAEETLDIYAPLANRLGIFSIKSELEDLCLLYLKPEVHQSLTRKIAEKEEEREQYIEEVKKIIGEKLSSLNLKESVSGRPKHLYSIYQKMEIQRLEFDHVYDLTAFRVTVDSEKKCYEALGIIHSLWKPIPGRFKDYIAMPKANGYQSLHTTVIGPHSKRMEIQIRTPQMHQVAEHGIAAHWGYKEGKDVGKSEDKKFAWLRQLLEWQQDLQNPREFLELVRIDLFPDEVYVFTPKGEVKQFPRGATPIDFAYSVHTDVGHRCRGARVNGKMVSLKYQLKNGDMVEIITSPNHNPGKDWFLFAKTSKAKTKIRQWIKIEEKNRDISYGRKICEKEFRKYGLNFAKMVKSDKLSILIKEVLAFHDLNDFLAAIGSGNTTPLQLIHKLIPSEKLEKKSRKTPKSPGKEKKSALSGIQIKGIDNIMVHFAKCCHPIPGDKILGYITRGRGVTVHSATCSYVKNIDPERKIEAEWTLREKFIHSVKIKVECRDKTGLLAEITSTISGIGANITRAEVSTSDKRKSKSIFEVDVKNQEHLANIIKSLENIDGVIRVKRLMG